MDATIGKKKNNDAAVVVIDLLNDDDDDHDEPSRPPPPLQQGRPRRPEPQAQQQRRQHPPPVRSTAAPAASSCRKRPRAGDDDDEGRRRGDAAAAPLSSACLRDDNNTTTTAPVDEPLSVASGRSSSSSPPPVSSPVIFLETDPNEDVEVTEGIVPLLWKKQKKLAEALRSSAAARVYSGAAVVGPGCRQRSPTLLHVQQKDKWSCGYRNAQMMISALLPNRRPGCISDGAASAAALPAYYEIPSLLRLQTALEGAWRNGYDPRSAEHFEGRVVGRRCFIGALEVLTALSSSDLAVDATVVQFVTVPESRALLGPFCLAYFCRCRHRRRRNRTGVTTSNGQGQEQQAAAATATEDDKSSTSIAKEVLRDAEETHPDSSSYGIDCRCQGPALPLYLQWEGHSVTVVGVEFERTARAQEPAAAVRITNLLVLDPMKNGNKLRACLEKEDWDPMRLPITKLRGKNCQILLCSAAKSLSPSEQQGCKNPNTKVLTAAQTAVRKALRP